MNTTITPTYVADLTVGQTVRWAKGTERTLTAVTNLGGRPPQFKLEFDGHDAPTTLFGSSTLQVVDS